MRVIRFIVNWIAILTVPVWGGIAIFVYMVFVLLSGDTSGGLVNSMKGDDWFWD